jgi:hypothetical protein
VQGEVYRRQAPPLDARAHAGDGDGAALEAGAAPPGETGRELEGPEAAAAIGAALDARTRDAGRRIVEALEATPDPVLDDAGLEAERRQEIRNAVRAARLPTEFGERLIREGVALVDAQQMIVATLSSKGDPS